MGVRSDHLHNIPAPSSKIGQAGANGAGGSTKPPAHVMRAGRRAGASATGFKQVEVATLRVGEGESLDGQIPAQQTKESGACEHSPAQLGIGLLERLREVGQGVDDRGSFAGVETVTISPRLVELGDRHLDLLVLGFQSADLFADERRIDAGLDRCELARSAARRRRAADPHAPSRRCPCSVVRRPGSSSACGSGRGDRRQRPGSQGRRRSASTGCPRGRTAICRGRSPRRRLPP